MNTTTHHSKYTPQHKAGFRDRLTAVFQEIRIGNRDHVRVTSEATGLTKIGVRRMLDSDRPPKNKEAFDNLVNFLDGRLKAMDINISEAMLTQYLLFDAKNPFKQEYSLTKFIEDDPILTSQIILAVEEIAKDNHIDTGTDIDSEKMKLIYFRICGYIFKNSISLNEEKAKVNILSLLQVSKDNVI